MEIQGDDFPRGKPRSLQQALHAGGLVLLQLFPSPSQHGVLRALWSSLYLLFLTELYVPAQQQVREYGGAQRGLIIGHPVFLLTVVFGQ